MAAVSFVAPLSIPQAPASRVAGSAQRERLSAPPNALRFATAGAVAPQPKAAPGVALLAGVALGAAAALRPRRRVARRAEDGETEDSGKVGQTYKPEDWINRVKVIEGERAVFDVTIPKPLGLTPRDFPNRPGVGVAKIAPDGNTDKLNKEVIMDGAPGMWVLEGDEVCAVNGVNVEGKPLEEVAPLVKNSEGDSITLTLCRAYMAGPVKVVFIPSGQNAVMKRGVEITQAASVGVQEVSYSCTEGWCKACWHTDPMFGVVYRACASQSKKRPPPKLSRTIPEKWNSIVPLWLLQWKDRGQSRFAPKKKAKA